MGLSNNITSLYEVNIKTMTSWMVNELEMVLKKAKELLKYPYTLIFHIPIFNHIVCVFEYETS